MTNYLLLEKLDLFPVLINCILQSALNFISLGCYENYCIPAMCCILSTVFEIIRFLSLFYTVRNQGLEIKKKKLSK